MNSYINLEKSNCKNCYKCIRHCPVKSIKFADHQAHIVKDECILCGMCYVVCPQKAKQIKNDVAVVKDYINSGKPVIASIAPSFVANFESCSITSIKEGLTKLGFTDVEETALGATYVKQKYEELIEQRNSSIIISSCCHTVNTLIQKYYPEALNYLASVQSPMQVHCSNIKKLNPEAYTVFIGPCISKKEEADLYQGFVDCVLTFEELSSWLQEENITLSPCKEESQKGRARLFPTSGGIIRSMTKTQDNFNYIAIDGVDNCMKALNDIISGNSLSNCFIEMSACVGSCVGGPVMTKEQRSPIFDYISVNHYACEEDFDFKVVEPDSHRKSFHFTSFNRQKPGSSAITDILHRMGKYSPEQELNCGSCGYNTCRDKAIAVYYGKADLTMCLPYLKERAENFSENIIYNTPNGIFVLNENLEVQQINRAAREIMKIKDKRDILGSPVVRILNPSVYIDVMMSGNNVYDKHTYLAEYQKYVEETIIYDKKYHIIISIMRDITEEEHQRLKKEQISKQTIEITDKVIEKQMRAVQEIASLLGETTAETKIALTKLKETLRNE